MRNRKDREEKIYIRAIIFIIPTMAIMILLLLFIINAPEILNKYDVIKSEFPIPEIHGKKDMKTRIKIVYLFMQYLEYL